MAGSRIRTVKITSAPHAFIAVGTRVTDRGIPITALVGTQGADFAPTTDTFTGLAITITIVSTAHTGHTTRRFHTERCVVRTPAMICWVTCYAGAFNALIGERLEAIAIVSTAYADIAIVSGHAEGGVPITTRVIIRVAHRTVLRDALPIGCLTITISRTTDTASILAFDHTDGHFLGTAGVIGGVTEDADFGHALFSAVAVSISSTRHAAIARDTGHAVRSRPATARVIGGITGRTLTCHALAIGPCAISIAPT